MSFLEDNKVDRTKFIGGSDLPIIMGESPYKSPYQLWLEKTGQVEPEDISKLFHVQRGKLNEPIALEKFLKQTKLDEHVTWESNKRFNLSPEYPHYACEVDGISEGGALICEIKCMGMEDHLRAKEGVVPDQYIPQIQWNLMITGAERCYFISYRPEDDTLYSVECLRDDKYMNALLKQADAFWEMVQTKTPPELTDMDFEDMSRNEEFRILCNEYISAKASLDVYEAEVKKIKDQLKSLMGDRKRAKASGVKLSFYERKGNVNYKKIPELKGLDLEPYRGKPSKVFRITMD